MRIGCPKEIKAQEYRVGLTPAGADALIRAGHTVYMERSAGLASGFPDGEYTAVGAQILPTAKEVYDTADMIVKVKEPLAPEYDLLHDPRRDAVSPALFLREVLSGLHQPGADHLFQRCTDHVHCHVQPPGLPENRFFLYAHRHYGGRRLSAGADASRRSAG